MEGLRPELSRGHGVEQGNGLGRCPGREARTCRWGKGREEVSTSAWGLGCRTRGAVQPPLHLGEVDELGGGVVCENAGNVQGVPIYPSLGSRRESGWRQRW